MHPPFRITRAPVHIGALAAVGSLAQTGVSLYNAFNPINAAQRASLDIGYNNYYLQQYMAAQQVAQNLRQQRLAQSATVDARGNVTEYVPGYGWVTKPSETSRAVMGAEDAEAIRRNTVDAMLARNQAQRTAGMHANEAGVANALLSRYKATPVTTGADVRSGDILSGVAAANDRTADVRTAALANVVRSGGTGIGSRAALTAANDSTRSGVIQALANAYRDSASKANAANAQTASSILDPYNAVAGRAQAPIDAPYVSSGIGNQLAQALAATRQGSVIGSAYGRTQPNAPNSTGLQGLLAQLGANQNAGWAAFANNAGNLAREASNIDWGDLFGSGGNYFGGSTGYTRRPSLSTLERESGGWQIS